MTEQLIGEIVKQSIFAGLFCYLLKYVLDTSKAREERMNQTAIEREEKLIQQNANNLEMVDKLADKIEALVDKVDEGFAKVWSELDQIKKD